MTTQAPPAAAAVPTVLIFHTGKGNGPMETAAGVLRPGASLEVPEPLAEKLCAAYKHIKLAKDVIPGGAADPRIAAENAMLKAEIAKLTKQLEDAPKGDAAALQAQVNDLQGRLAEFLNADKKTLAGLQEKHADAAAPVAADKEPVAA